MTDPKPLSAAELAEVRARCEAATPGPWEQLSGKYMCIDNGQVPQRFETFTADDELFCEHARVDIPRLLATIEAREQAWQDDVAHIRQMWINAIRIVQDNPRDIALIGREPNPVREALEPVASLRAKFEQVEKQRDGLLAALKNCRLGFGDVRQGYLNLIEFRKCGDRYGELTREELNAAITGMDAMMAKIAAVIASGCDPAGPESGELIRDDNQKLTTPLPSPAPAGKSQDRN